MKKFFTLIAALAIVGTAAAQSPWSFGPKVGINIASVHSTNGTADDLISGAKAGFIVGGFAEYRMSNLFALSADLLYSRKGSMNETTYSSPVNDASVKSKMDYRLGYLDVPIMANFYVTKGLALKAGLQPSFLLSGKLKQKITEYNIDISDVLVDETTDVKSDMHSVDLAIPVGVSYTFDFGLIVDVRYNFACTNILKHDDGESGKLRNRVGTITVGWKF